MRWLLLFLIASASAQPQIVAVVPDLPGQADGDEAVALWSPANWSLAGYALTDGEDTMPLRGTLTGGEMVWYSGNDTYWQSFGMPPSRPLTLALGNAGDQIELTGPVRDGFAWGKQTSAEMRGTMAYTSPGAIYARSNELGQPLRPLAGGTDLVVDSDSVTDWMSSRIHRVGETNWPRPTFDVPSMSLYSSPDNSHAVLLEAIQSAQRQLHLHVYLLSHPTLAPALADAATRGVDVQVLIDGNPVGQDQDDRDRSAWSMQQIVDAGGQAFVAGNDRYRFHHLKVLVADDSTYIQSENWVDSGVPRDPSTGNRGWGVGVHDERFTDYMTSVLSADRHAWDTTPFEIAAFAPAYREPYWAEPRTGSYQNVKIQHLQGEFKATPIVTPEHTLLDTRLTWIAAAKERVWLQELDLQGTFSNSLGFKGTNPMLDTISRLPGEVDVRVLVAPPFHYSDTGNVDAINWLQLERPQSQVGLANRPGITTFHNKGVIVDDIVILGSQNSNHNSRTQNREIGVVLEGQGVADYYATLFAGDWEGTSGRDWATVGEDLRSIPAGLPMLIVAFVLATLRGRAR